MPKTHKAGLVHNHIAGTHSHFWLRPRSTFSLSPNNRASHEGERLNMKSLLAWFKRGAVNVLIAGDQFVNTVFGGDPDETISSRAGKAMRGKKPPLWARFVTWITEPLDKNHVQEAIEKDEGKNSL